MSSNNKYDFFNRKPSGENPFISIFEHDGLKRSSGVRPVRDDLREAQIPAPDTSNYEEGNVMDDDSEFMDDDSEFMDDGIPIFNVDPVGVDVTPAEESVKGLRIGEGSNKNRDFSLSSVKNVSRETKSAQSIYDDDVSGQGREEERERMRDEGLYHENPDDLRRHNAIAEIRLSNLSSETKDIAIDCILGKTSKASNVGVSVTRRLAKGPGSCSKGKDLKDKWWMVDTRDSKDSVDSDSKDSVDSDSSSGEGAN